MHSLIGLVQTSVKQTRRVLFVWSREKVGNLAQQKKDFKRREKLKARSK